MRRTAQAPGPSHVTGAGSRTDISWSRVRSRASDDTGAETVELALLLPLFLLLAFAVMPIMEFFSANREANRIADETAIFATRASDNPAQTSDMSACGDLTRRRSYPQVNAYARSDASIPIQAVDVFIQPPGADPPAYAGSSSAHPCLADPTSHVHVRITGEYSTGPLADGINAIARLVGATGGVVPGTATLTATSVGYLE